jgi:hypothetical protein
VPLDVLRHGVEYRCLGLANGEIRLTLTPDDADDTDRMIHAYLS